MSTYQVQHDPSRRLFWITFEGQEKAVLEYRPLGPNHYDFYRTYVPPTQRGKGIADQLALAAFKEMEKQNAKINPSCSFIDTFFTKNPEWKHLESKL
uniref:N-acetyltransferase domain-containing protein n=1 Tax=Arcella intermedia TaxID=1963864 RepID=A0A6B2LUZ9_9EUKA